MLCSACLLLTLAATDFVAETIALGFPEERGEQLALAVVHEPEAVERLERFTAAELARGGAPAPHRALEMIAYGGHEASLAALERLRPLAPAVVEPYVGRALEHAVERSNPFALAYRMLARSKDAAFRESVLAWAETALASESKKRARLWAQARPRNGAVDPIGDRLARRQSRQ